MITIVYKKPYEKPYIMEIENSLVKFQELVDGYIEVIPANEDGSILMVINEEGKLKGLEVNVYIGNTSIVGNVIFALRGKDGEFDSLTDDMINALIKILS